MSRIVKLYNFAKDNSYEEWLTFKEAQEKFNKKIPQSTFMYRLEKGLSAYDALITDKLQYTRRKSYNFAVNDLYEDWMTIPEAINKFNSPVKPSTVYYRISNGISPYDAVNINASYLPLKKYNFAKDDSYEEWLTINEVIEKYNLSIDSNTIYMRIYRGMKPYKAITNDIFQREKAKYNFAKDSSYEEWLTITDAIEKYHSNVKLWTAYYRITQLGLTPYEAITAKKLLKKRTYDFSSNRDNSELLTIDEAIQKYNPELNYNTVYIRINRNGMSPYNAIMKKYRPRYK